MLYFYRYDDASTILNSSSILKKFGINVEKMEMIIIENISEEL